jgi:signal transduction histidine kinase
MSLERNRDFIDLSWALDPPNPFVSNLAAVTLLGLLIFWVRPSLGEELSSDGSSEGLLRIHSVTVGGKAKKWDAGRELSLGPAPEEVAFNFGPATNSGWMPKRLRYTLQGYESVWHEGAAVMGLTVRYADEHGDQIGQTIFEARGESAGWNGTLANSPLSHRRETLVAPPRAARVWVTISSGIGPPATVGIYVLADLFLSRLSSTNSEPEILLHPVFDLDSSNSAPARWVRDGIQPSMARIVELGNDPKVRAFAILDEDPLSHAEWHNRRETAPAIAPGDRLVLEWNELFSIGVGDASSATYPRLPHGEFRFRVQELTALGTPTGVEDFLKLHVPVPMWETPFFWPAVLTAIIAGAVGTSRYLAWYRMRHEVVRLKHQRALEQERLRIAQDIHDDLGARVTQISLLSAVAQGDASFPEKARADFDRISRMTRELVSALYETVWAVNPENDNLDALGNYLCQMVNQLCVQARLRCRLNVVDLPRDIQVSSQTRHNVAMAVKEAVHNVIKHAKAEEVTLRVSLVARRLTVSVQDDGRGFEPLDHPGGSGLKNMQRRLADLGGNCSIQSKLGGGTTVEMTLGIKSPE